MEPRDFFATYYERDTDGTLLDPEQLTTGSASDWRKFLLGGLIGAGAAAAAYMVVRAMSAKQDRRVLRLEDSVQIGRRVEDVFRAWSDFEQLPELLDFVKSVQVQGSESRWQVTIDGKDFAWDARTVQFIPNQAIGWKSINGPHHTGRITFAPLGDDTMLQVTINYAPPLGGLGAAAVAPFTENLEEYLSRALREFKRAVETQREVSGGHRLRSRRDSGTGKVDERHPPARAEWKNASQDEERSTGTANASAWKPEVRSKEQPKNPVDYTRPPKPKS